MVKKVLIVFLLLFSTLGFSDSQYDKNIVIKNQSRNDKVVSVFKKMMQAYEEEDLSRFFSYVSEDRFIQDYMTFYDAIDKDMRTYDILNIDTWVDKITKDGVKRYLYVKWDKRYQSTNSDTELEKKGYSRFLFDEVNGKYKLIGLAGNNFWGESLAEWKEEVPQIAGQEPEEQTNGNDTADNGLPDLVVRNLECGSDDKGIIFYIANIGNGTAHGPIEYTYGLGEYSNVNINYATYDGSADSLGSGEYSGNILPGESVYVVIDSYCNGSFNVYVDPNNKIEELDEDNNQASSNSDGI